MNVLITEPEYFDAEARSILASVGTVSARRLGRAGLARTIGRVDVLVVRIETRLDRGLLDRARRLKVIGSATTGLDHIDLDRARALGIEVLSLHGTHTVPTAQHALALMLSLARRIPWAFESLRDGIWRRHRAIGTQLDGKTLGVIGLGRIGRQVARYAKALGMKVVYHDPYVRSRLGRRTGLKALLRSSDVVTVHAALTGETDGMVGWEQLRLMKRDALLVNTARGRIVSEAALLRALREGVIKGAALDVFSREPLAGRGGPLAAYARGHGNLLLTPHIAASTAEAAHGAGVEIARRIRAYCSSGCTRA